MTNEISKVTITEDFEVIKNAEGKFERKAIYQPFSSVQAETREEKIKLMNMLNDENSATPVNEVIGAKILLKDVIFNPYDRVDEETGEVEYGVLTYMVDNAGVAYVTSSKSVYHTLKNIFKAFGLPTYNEGEELKIEFVKKQGQQFKYTDIKLLG